MTAKRGETLGLMVTYFFFSPATFANLDPGFLPPHLSHLERQRYHEMAGHQNARAAFFKVSKRKCNDVERYSGTPSLLSTKPSRTLVMTAIVWSEEFSRM
eukprot:CAMPEP_0174318494 /NCGR_PEP_ID=MMETSP0810-20121108/8249_1 /TAXON_ID=73025 ORGANISM="Eutreptiella gymnastica-like, Strain CCMP1594" /NCGR_SAMPLE_ID=MMETSP0810 /ASSEMBLY_ACC=CAM_ASM_000659 /LENGTH=99 /DNA_ID=CAMNT_0015428749 /DNA_START=53 /DNA_END=352 /DNA_ORIENTATION=+